MTELSGRPNTSILEMGLCTVLEAIFLFYNVMNYSLNFIRFLYCSCFQKLHNTYMLHTVKHQNDGICTTTAIIEQTPSLPALSSSRTVVQSNNVFMNILCTLYSLCDLFYSALFALAVNLPVRLLVCLIMCPMHQKGCVRLKVAASHSTVSFIIE